ncbi:MAG: DUF6089 family protein [Bacteroidota bacterium]|nr:DUF6089 family protein [Bacteroidota bacterium]
MKIVVSHILLFCCFLTTVTAQVKEFGLFAGGAYYRGELNRTHFSQSDYSIGGIFKQDFPNDRLSLRFQLLYSQVKADDFKSGNTQQLNRNLSFKSSVIEFGPVLEIDFFKFHPGQNNTAKAAFGTPYFMGGINIMRMNPKTRYNGEWIELQPLGTEGQGTSLPNAPKKYSLNQIVIPFGIGIKVNLSHHSSFSMEYGIRKTFTDYLDDVSGIYPDLTALNPLARELSDRARTPEGVNQSSYGLQRGNPADKDWYSVFGFSITYEFFSDSTCPSW